MLEDITVGQYLPGKSMLHRLDPRTKLASTVVFSVALFIAATLPGYLLVSAFTILVIALSGVPIRFLLKGLRPLLFLLGLTLVLHLFATPGETVWRLGPFPITREGLWKGGLMSLRLVLLVLGTSLLTLTTSPIALTDGLEHLLSPGKRMGIPAHELAMMMSIALRFVPTLIEETQKIMKAQASRGADFESGNLLQRARNLIPLLVPLFVNAFRRADELATAMESRCYRGGKGRTRMKEMKAGARDLIAGFCMLLFMAAVIASRSFGPKPF